MNKEEQPVKNNRSFLPKSISVVLALIMVLTCFTIPAFATETRDINGLKLPIANGDVTVTIMCSNGALSEYGKSLSDSDFPAIDEVMTRTGLTIKFRAYNSDAYKDALNTVLASGTDLPDAFVASGADLTKLAKDGIIANLKDYINEENTPNLMKFFQEYPDIYGSLIAPDGGIYGLPNRVSPYDGEYSCLVLGYRKDWADKLGLAAPNTIEDWYKMLTAFHTGDPNGNGDPTDEIPFVCAASNKIYDFSLAYGMSPWSNWFSVIDGKVCYDFTSDQNKDKAKAYLTEMHKWYAEGLLDPDLNTDHGDKAEAKLLSNQGGAETNWNGYWPYYNTQMATQYPGTNWATALPPIGPSGDRAYENYPANNNERFIITTANKNIVDTLKLYDYVFATEEGQLLTTLGIEGDTYTVADGKLTLTDKILNNQYGSRDVALMLETGEAFPKVLGRDYMDNIVGADMPDSEKQILRDASPFFRTMFPNVIATQEESDTISTKMTDIQTYQQEMFFKFVLGDTSLDQYDAFVAQLKSMGIDEIVAVKQAQYDRFAGK